MKYKLSMNVRIDQADEHGYPVGGGGLQILEDLRFEADSFLGIAHVLGRFHELAESIKAKETVS